MYLQETLTKDQARHMIGRGIGRAHAESCRREINMYGVDPAETLIQIMQWNTVLAVSNTVLLVPSAKSIVVEIMAQLKQAGATHVAIITPSKNQRGLDWFMRTGKYKQHVPYYLRPVCEAARNVGLKLVAVWENDGDDILDAGMIDNFNHDRVASDNINTILDGDDDDSRKVIFFDGVQQVVTNGSFDPRSASTAQFLRRRYNVHSVLELCREKTGPHLHHREPNPYLVDIAVGLTKPVAIPTAMASSVGMTVYDFQNVTELKSWDYIIIHPS